MLLGHDLPYIHITRPLITIIITISPGKKCHPDTQACYLHEHNEHPLVSRLPSAVCCGILAGICSWQDRNVWLLVSCKCPGVDGTQLQLVCILSVTERGPGQHNPTYSPNYEESEHHPLELPLLRRGYFIAQYTNHRLD